MSFVGQIDFATAIPVEAVVPAWGAIGADAMFDLGLQYSTGRMVQVDLIAAHKWFNLAALKGRDDARAMRQEIAAMMSMADIATAQRDARDWSRAH